MKRRTLLRSIGTLGVIVPLHSPVRATSTHSQRPTVTDWEFDILDRKTGNGIEQSTANVSAREIELTGTITGQTSCHSAEVADWCLANGLFAVTIVTTEPDEKRVCLPALTEIEYRATFTFEPVAPSDVAVQHDDRSVLNTTTETDTRNEQPSSGTASPDFTEQ